MKKLEFYVRFLEDILKRLDFTINIEEDESPIEEISYYKGFVDAIQYLKTLQEK